MGFWQELFSSSQQVLSEAREAAANASLSYAVQMPKQKVRLLEQVFENPDAGTEFDDRFFKDIGGGVILDLPPQIMEKAQRLSMLLYRKNVRAFNTVELIKDFVLGDGVRFTAADDKVKELLDEHWEMNDWEDKLAERIRSLSVFGEQMYPTFVNKETGLVRLSSVTPLRIRRVSRNPKDAEDLLQVIAVLGPSSMPASIFAVGSVVAAETKKFDIIKLNKEARLVGDTFYFAVNRIAGATRGLPDMLSAVDWLEGMDGYVFSLLERAELTQAVVYELLCKGLNKKELKEKSLAFANSLAAGGIYAHNEKVELKIQSPDLKGSDAKDVVSILLKQIQSGTRLAGLFFGDAADLTRSSASELSIPVAKAIQGRQNFIKRMLAKIFRFQIEQGIKAGRLSGVKNFHFEIGMSKVFLRDMSTVTKSLGELSAALDLAVERDWISQEQAGVVFRNALEQLGTPMAEPESINESLPLDVRGYMNILDRKTLEGGNGRDQHDNPARTEGKASAGV